VATDGDRARWGKQDVKHRNVPISDHERQQRLPEGRRRREIMSYFLGGID